MLKREKKNCYISFSKACQISLKALASLLEAANSEAECSRSHWNTSSFSSHYCQSSYYSIRQQHRSGKSSPPFTILSFSNIEHIQQENIMHTHNHTHTLTLSPIWSSLSFPSVYKTKIELADYTWAENGQAWEWVETQRVPARIWEGHFLGLFFSPVIANITLNYH